MLLLLPPGKIILTLSPPLALSPKDQNRWTTVFGSYHPAICQFVFADGSVHSLKISIDTTTLGRLAVRDDGLAVTTDY